MDDETRHQYRCDLSHLARHAEITEIEAARAVLEHAQKGPETHVGYYLYRRPLGAAGKKRRGNYYIGLIILVSLVLTVFAGIALNHLLVFLLLLVPVSDIVKNLTDFMILRSIRPKHTPRLELREGIPPEGKTLCVVSALLSSKRSGVSTARSLEEYYLANRDCGSNLLFGILADLPESDLPNLPADSDCISSAEMEIEKLNTKYGGGFFLFCRRRIYNRPDARYMGWERKRGAILELMRYFRGDQTSMVVCVGDTGRLDSIRYLITLDIDTRLSAGAARELVGAALHPLNRPVIDKDRKIVSSGSGIFQPRISVDLSASNKTDFTRIFAGQGGIDPYSSASSDVYQDLFGEGSFTGKGLIDVDAYLTCLDTRFPDNAVLSHDLLEGAYMHCTYVGDTELTDGYPARITSYYDRLNRWTRGDWQASPWLLRSVKNSFEQKERNVLNKINRWKLFDNLRRSLVPVFTFSALMVGLFSAASGFVWAASISVLAMISNLVISSAEQMFRRDPGKKARYYSTIISGFGAWLLQMLTRILFLPFEAWTCFHAVVTALYRMIISHKKRLAWVTAADSEKKSDHSIIGCYRKMAFCVLTGVAVLVFSPFASAAALAIVWILSPLYAYSLGRETHRERKISPGDELFLKRCAGSIWSFFEDFITAEDHYLPPDNWQEQPAVGLAHRTSPTNIGLAMLSALAAIDLGLSPKQNALGMIENMLTTIDRLPKWHGHLYNWYDTRTLKVLEPAYVSSVDSGNLAGCLIALREGLRALNEERLADKIDQFLGNLHLRALFDVKRKLFHIGWDCSKNAPTESWYDLMASEARQTSYIAIARGDVPRKHWRRLSRALVSQDYFSGMASWTGTMFEYMMPNLLLPCYENSLIYESLKFCLSVQRKRVSSIPWGISESAFYDFDNALNYRYKAHGVQRLALRRGMDRETVISPYSSFLALPVDLKAALANLRKLQKMNMEGRYGFYEAADFTPNRQNAGSYQIVSTYMAHHLGMSLIAIDNTLHQNIMQKRFMSDREMAAYAELLQEKVPVGEIVLRQPPREVPEKPYRSASPGWSRRLDGVDVKNPACCVYGNGAYSVLLTESGMTRSKWGNLTLTKFAPVQFSSECGMSFFLKTDRDLISLLPAPVYDNTVQYSSEFLGARGTITARKGDALSAVSVVVPRNEAGELRTVSIVTGAAGQVRLLCYFEPVLACLPDYLSHPAFSKMSLETFMKDGSVVIRRRAHGKNRDLYLCFSCSLPMTTDTSRENALGRGGFRSLQMDAAQQTGGAYGAVLDPCVLANVDIHLKQGEVRRIRFALALASTATDAYMAAQRILTAAETESLGRMDLLAHRFKMSMSQIQTALERITDLVFVTDHRKQLLQKLPVCTTGKRGLWPFAISGDLPILTAIMNAEQERDAASELIGEHIFLSHCGVNYDLVFLISDGGDYRCPIKQTLVELMRNADCESAYGVFAGIHLIDRHSDGVEAIMSASVQIVNLGQATQLERHRTVGIFPVEICKPLTVSTTNFQHFFRSNGHFVFQLRNRLPPNAWSHMLANDQYGFLATDAGTGHMWHLNARENKVNRWLNDSLTTEGTEKLLLREGDKRCSLFANFDDFETTVTYGPGFACWEKQKGDMRVKTTAFVPPGVSARVLIIEPENLPPHSEVEYFTQLVLGESMEQSPLIRTGRFDGVISAQNPSNTDFPCDTFYLFASVRERAYTCNSLSWRAGHYDGETGAGMLPCAAALYPADQPLVIVTGCDDPEKLKVLANLRAARQALEETAGFWQEVTGHLHVKTPDVDLNTYLNGWAVYQTLACRLYGRTSLYQSGGAYGFRDQLQDVCALIAHLPEEAKQQMVRAAEHQFEEGDVQHWWHPGTAGDGRSERGVRTRCSDDLVWLVYALCLYTEKTSDYGFCRTETLYIHSPILADDEQERYERPEFSQEKETILQHAMRAMNLVLSRGTGDHGLCLIGTGDWNDGMNLVGAGGKGESVWLTWFVSYTLNRFSVLCDAVGCLPDAERYRNEGEKLRRSADGAWDGEWYLRGYYDDGTPLGSRKSDECQIDSIAQSFGALAGGDTQRVRTALRSAISILFDRETDVVKLFSPPFSSGRKMPGYIKGYSPGFRENGGQYTHGAIWLAMGLFLAGMTEDGWAVLKALLPQKHDVERYRAEPYVLAADVYSNENHVGRGGWTWYTGAAGWYYRIAVENMLGLCVRDGRLFVEPHLPSDWKGFEAVWKDGPDQYDISVKVENGCRIFVNGAPYDEHGYPLRFHKFLISN